MSAPYQSAEEAELINNGQRLERIIQLLEQLVEVKQTGSTVTQFTCKKCHSLTWRVNPFGLCDNCVRMAGGAL